MKYHATNFIVFASFLIGEFYGNRIFLDVTKTNKLKIIMNELKQFYSMK